MKRRFVFCLGAMLFAGTLAAQTPVPEWQAGVDKVKSLIKTNPEQASDAAGELLKGKNKKNVELVTSVARAYLDVGQLKEAETYLEMARKADNKAPAVSVLEGDIALINLASDINSITPIVNPSEDPLIKLINEFDNPGSATLNA